MSQRKQELLRTCNSCHKEFNTTANGLKTHAAGCKVVQNLIAIVEEHETDTPVERS